MIWSRSVTPIFSTKRNTYLGTQRGTHNKKYEKKSKMDISDICNKDKNLTAFLKHCRLIKNLIYKKIPSINNI